MSLRLRATNFRALRAVEMIDDGNVSIVIGKNECGKSSLIGSIQFAFSGQAFGHKGREDIKALILHGADRLSVSVDVGGIAASRTTTTGDALKVVAERLGVAEAVLPVLFNSEMAGDCGSKAMLAFLSGAASSKFDASTHFAADQTVKYYIDLAYRAGKFTTKEIIKFCEENRAAQKEPPAPIRPSRPCPAPEAIAAAHDAVQAATAAISTYESQQTGLNTTALALDAVTNHLANLAAFEAASKAAAVTDPLRDVRPRLQAVCNLNLNTVQAFQQVLTAANMLEAADAVAKAVSAITAAATTAAAALANNPAPVAPPPMPVLAAHAVASYDELKAAGLLDVNKIAGLAAGLSAQRSTVATQLNAARVAYQQAQTHRDDLVGVRGAWASFNETEPAYAQQCLKAKEEWARWDHAAKSIQTAETDFLRSQGAGFESTVNEIGKSLLQGRTITVDPTVGVKLGLEHIKDLSKSTLWRVEAAVMTAIAITVKSPLLVLDGADILDDDNRADFIATLLSSIAPHFKHILVTATRTNLDAEKPLTTPGVTKWLLRAGQLTKCA